MEKATIKAICQAFANLLIICYLLLEAVKVYKELPNKQKDADPAHALLLELEPQFYLGSASILMSATFGKPDTKIGKLAYKALKEMIKEDIAQNA